MEWISVKDKLPENDDDVWGFMIDELWEGDEYNKRMQAVVNYRGEYGWHTPFDDIDDRINVTHWMPLPNPPKD